MKIKNRKIRYLLSLSLAVLLGYALWLAIRPVEIIAVHQRRNHSDVLVKTFPFTTQGKINWWLENEKILKEKYDIPKPASYGGFTIIFWYFGDGYKEEGKYDRFCFEDMKTKKNCIEKEHAFEVSYSDSMGMTFITDSGEYRLNKNGKVVKVKLE